MFDRKRKLPEQFIDKLCPDLIINHMKIKAKNIIVLNVDEGNNWR